MKLMVGSTYNNLRWREGIHSLLQALMPSTLPPSWSPWPKDLLQLLIALLPY